MSGPARDLNYFMKYFRGDLPFHFGKSWVKEKKVYTIFHIKDAHWISLEINLHDRLVTYYDCNHNFSKDNEIKTALSILYEALPRLWVVWII